MLILQVVGALALVALAVSAAWAARALSYRNDPAPLVAERLVTMEEIHRLDTAVAFNDEAIAKLTLAVSDGIERVSRAENRISKTVTSARRLVRENGLEHAGIEAEFEELQSRDAEAIEPLPAMPEQVGETRTVRVPGGTIEVGVR